MAVSVLENSLEEFVIKAVGWGSSSPEEFGEELSVGESYKFSKLFVP